VIAVQLAPSESAARERLAELGRLHPLPVQHALQEVFLQEVAVGALQLFMVGLVAAAGEGTVIGSAAGPHGFPVERAYFELLERACIALASARHEPLTLRDEQGATLGQREARAMFPPQRQGARRRLARSNGVALQRSWPLACASALDELVERDRILRSFAGEIAPHPLAEPDPALSAALASHYRLQAHAFDPVYPDLRHRVAGLFLFPRSPELPLVYGFGAGAGRAAALAAATREAVQRLAFLWGEELPAAAPEPAPVPDYHQDFYLYPPHHALLLAWLAGERVVATPAERRGARPFETHPVAFLDLTPAGALHGLCVAKAVAPRARPLRFGRAAGDLARSLPHPVV
jgi:YcaO cyclodehydratase, ATP-ad Mg2+-binding